MNRVSLPWMAIQLPLYVQWDYKPLFLLLHLSREVSWIFRVHVKHSRLLWWSGLAPLPVSVAYWKPRYSFRQFLLYSFWFGVFWNICEVFFIHGFSSPICAEDVFETTERLLWVSRSTWWRIFQSSKLMNLAVSDLIQLILSWKLLSKNRKLVNAVFQKGSSWKLDWGQLLC